MKKIILILGLIFMVILISGCENEIRDRNIKDNVTLHTNYKFTNPDNSCDIYFTNQSGFLFEFKNNKINNLSDFEVNEFEKISLMSEHKYVLCENKNNTDGSCIDIIAFLDIPFCVCGIVDEDYSIISYGFKCNTDDLILKTMEIGD